MQEIVAHLAQLQGIFGYYERLLSELAILITNYEVLYSEVIMDFLTKKLKSQKKNIAVEKPALVMLRSSIRRAY